MKIMACFGNHEDINNIVAETALKYAKIFNASVLITRGVFADSNTQDYLIAKSQESLNRVKSIYVKNDITCEVHTVLASVTIAEALINFANENRVEKIIIGIRQKSKVGKLVFGSTAQELILNAPCPVISVH